MENAAFQACGQALHEALGGGDGDVSGSPADEEADSEFTADLWAGRAIVTVTLRQDLSFELEARDLAFGGVILHQSIGNATPGQLQAAIRAVIVAVGGAPRP